MNSLRFASLALFLLIVTAISVLPPSFSSTHLGTERADVGIAALSPPPSPAPRMKQAGLPLYFEANAGQTDPRVKFLSRGVGYTLFLTSEGATLSILALPSSTTPIHSAPVQDRLLHRGPAAPTRYSSDSLQLKLVSANTRASVTGDSPQSGRVNYFVGKDPSRWHTGITTYKGVRYAQIYPGVDMLFHEALEKDRDLRYQHASEMRSDLARLKRDTESGLFKVASDSPFPSVQERGFDVRMAWSALRRSRARPWLLLTAAPILLAALGSFLLLHYHQRRNVAASITGRRSVAVLGFKNLSRKADADWLGTTLSEMLATELSVGENLRTIPAENVTRVKMDLGLQDTDSLAADTLSEIHKNLGSDLVVLGSYLDLAGQVRLDLRLQDAAKGETIATISETGSEEQLLEVVNRAGTELRKRCGLAQITEGQAAEVRASSPSNPEATRLYAEGLHKLRIFDTRGAIVLLEKASAEDPDFALVHSSLAEAWSKLGYGQRAIREASKAVDLSANLSREEQLSIQGQYRAATKEWSKAVEIYGELFGLFPDDIEYGLSLASAQTYDGKSPDAITTLDALRKLPPPVGDDPRLDLAEAFAADTLGDYQRELKAAKVAVNKGDASGSRFVVARALKAEGVALRALGENKAAMAILEQATDLYAALGDKGGKPLIMIGNISAEQGDFDKAISVYEEALRSAREIGDRATECFALTNTAHVHLDRGDLAGAKPLYIEALGIQQEIEDKRNEGSTLSNLGHLLYELGNYSEASKTLNESLSIARQVGNRRSEAYVLSFLGELLYAQGNLDESKKRSEEALGIARAIGHKRVVQSSLLGMGSVLLAEANFEAAQKAQEDGITIAKEIGEKGSAAQCRLALAQISLEKGLPTEAEALAREPVEEFRAEKALGKEATAQALLVRSLLAQGKVSSAQSTLKAADVAAEHTQNHLVRFDVDVAGALVHAASHRTTEAENNLRGIVTRVETIGCVPCGFEARLALGEIEVESGRVAAGRSVLEKLKKDAADKGYQLIAEKADAVAR